MVQPFLPWGDIDNYVLAPGGNIEQPRSTWMLRGGAVAVEGNEPWMVGAPTDHRSLSLPAGSSATTAPMCIGVEHRTMRFFAKSRQSGSLTVDVLYADDAGKPRSVRIGTVNTLASWAPTAVLPMVVNELAAARGNAMMVSLRFQPSAATSASIDDVYVDPYRFK